MLTVLFTDIVGSTELAAELEDRRWRALLARHHDLVRRQVRRFRGREVDTAGDGFLVAFEEPTAGIRCAWAITELVRELGLEVRAGLHTGEVEIEDGKIGGIAVHTAARIVGHAGPGEVLVSGTLRELAAGSGAGFEDRGRRRLRGVPGTWHVFQVADLDGVPRAAEVASEIAAERRSRASEPPHRRRRTAMTLIAAGVSLAAVGFLVVVLRGTVEAPPRDESVLVQVDPATAQVTHKARLDLPRWRGLAAGEGGIWVVEELPGGYAVAHVDPSNADILARIELSGATVPKDVIVGQRSVWVMSSSPGLVSILVSQINPATDQVLQEAEVGSTQRNDPAGIAIGERAVWVVTRDGVIARIDPVRNEVVDQRDAISSAAAIAAGEGFVWVIDELADAVYKIEPSTLQVAARIAMSGSADSIAVGEGSVWILDARSGTVVRVNPQTNAVDDPIRVGDQPRDMIVAEGWVWVVNRGDGTVSRVDPTTGAVRSIEVGGIPTAIAADADTGTIWVGGPEAPPQPF